MQEVTDEQHQWQVSQEFQLLGKALTASSTTSAGCTTSRRPATYMTTFRSSHFCTSMTFERRRERELRSLYPCRLSAHDPGASPPAGATPTRRPTSSGARAISTTSRSVVATTRSTAPRSLRYFPAIPDSQAWHIFDPTLGMQYHFNPDLMAYASWGKGFKAGGWTTRLSAVITTPSCEIPARVLEDL